MMNKRDAHVDTHIPKGENKCEQKFEHKADVVHLTQGTQIHIRSSSYIYVSNNYT